MNLRTIVIISTVAMASLVAGCGGSSQATSPATTMAGSVGSATTAAPVTFTAQVWADNWFSLYVNGKKVGQDSVPITTVRSFNAETITFTASYPLTIAMVSKDYVENVTGLEYIGTSKQQMGDGGFIAQFTDTSTGKVVATTTQAWKGKVIFRAPLNTGCVTSPDPATTCKHEVLPAPAGWTSPTFDDSGWTNATVYTETEVQPHGDYSTLTWSPDAKLIWSGDLKVDNTILWRVTVPKP